MPTSDESSIPLRLAERMAAASERGADASASCAADVAELRLELRDRHAEVAAILRRVEPMLNSYEGLLKAEHDEKERARVKKAVGEQELTTAQTQARVSVAKLWARSLAGLVWLEGKLASPKGLIIVATVLPLALQQCGIPRDLLQLAEQAISVYAGDMSTAPARESAPSSDNDESRRAH